MSNSKLTRSVGAILVMIVGCAAANAQQYTLDPASPEVPAPLSAADISPSFGPAAPPAFTAANLGLIPADVVDAFSFGLDTLYPVGSDNWVRLAYSVTPGSVGAGGPITAEIPVNGAAGDKWIITIRPGGQITGPFRLSDSTMHGLTPLPPAPESDINGLSNPLLGPGARVCLSVDPATATRLGVSPADILLQTTTTGAPPAPAVFATAAALGLAPGDDIDALAMKSVGATLAAGDVVYISLTPGSPTLGALGISAAAVIQVFPAPMTVVVPPGALDLLAGDDLNALTAFDPGNIPTVSEWGLIIMTLLLLTAGTIVLGRRRRPAVAA